MQAMPKPVVPYDTKPATEWICDGPVQKVSPRFTHARIQGTLMRWLEDWAEERGRVGIEWRVWLTPPGEQERYLVPDVMYISYDRLPRQAHEAAEEPHLAPDAVFEVRSLGDRNRHIAHKVDVYLNAGTCLVAIVDPYERLILLQDPEAMHILHEGDSFEHAALPGFTFQVSDLFAKLTWRK